mmetsp:Transcript_81494/g.253249  ORF Transcript_81494/g.253249 Transcript_81494/m.253249 type:complete len:261 (+) Transcript_81494:925-1707(+)
MAVVTRLAPALGVDQFGVGPCPLGLGPRRGCAQVPGFPRLHRGAARPHPPALRLDPELPGGDRRAGPLRLHAAHGGAHTGPHDEPHGGSHDPLPPRGHLLGAAAAEPLPAQRLGRAAQPGDLEVHPARGLPVQEPGALGAAFAHLRWFHAEGWPAQGRRPRSGRGPRPAGAVARGALRPRACGRAGASGPATGRPEGGTGALGLLAPLRAGLLRLPGPALALRSRALRPPGRLRGVRRAARGGRGALPLQRRTGWRAPRA